MKIKELLKRYLKPFSNPLLAIFAGLVVGGIIMAISGYDPIKGIFGIIKGGFFSKYAIASTLARATPIIFCGLAAAISWGSGYSSMGAQGQMILGAITASYVAIKCPGPSWLVMIVTLLSAMIVGGLYSLLSAHISYKYNAYLLIVTLMFNYVADYFASYLTNYVLLDPYGVDKLAIQTQKIEKGILPRIFPKYTLHYGFFIALLGVLIIWFLINKTSLGYKMRMTGANSNFARYGGINASKTMYISLFISGAIAALGGACEVLGSKYRYVDAMITSPGYSWSGITAGLMSNYNIIGVLFSSIFLAGIAIGGASVELNLNIPSELTQVIQGVITILVTARIAINYHKKLKREEKKQ